MTDTFDEARGMALAAMTLAFSTVALMAKTERFSKAEIDDLFEGVLETLETFPGATTPAVGIARQLIDGMARVVATYGTNAPKSDQTE